MNTRLKIERLVSSSDARGVVVEPIGPRELPFQKNAHLVLTATGSVRGNHFHRQGTEITVVLGPALVRYREGGEIRDLVLSAGEAVRLTIPPGVPHAIQNTGSEPMVLVGFNTVAHEPSQPDVVREVLIET
jgi:UDP-2-acetamido-2,6-beta-L-arabino-hexul-4-ose reductase